MINRLQEQTAATLAKFVDRINTLEETKQALNLTPGFTLGPVLSLSADEPKRLKPRLTDPGLYKGDNVALYFQFEELLRAKLQIDRACIGGETKQV